jgi:hypothetical protein
MPRLGDLASGDYGYSDLGVPIGAANIEPPKVTDYGQADLRPFAMGALGQQDAYRPTSAQGTDLWGYQMGGTEGPMINQINRSIETTHRLTGMPIEEIVVRGLIKKEIPMYGIPAAVMGGLASQDNYQTEEKY